MLAATAFLWSPIALAEDVPISPVSFHLQAGKESGDTMTLTTLGMKESLELEKVPRLTAADVQSARLQPPLWSDAEERVFERRGMTLPPLQIGIEFTPEGATKLNQLTSRNLNRRLGILVRGQLVAAPVIYHVNTRGGLSVIAMFSTDEAKGVVNSINEAVQEEPRGKALIKELLKLASSFDRTAHGFSPITENSPVRLEIHPYTFIDAQLNIESKTHHTLAFGEVDGKYRWTGETESFKGPQQFWYVDGYATESIELDCEIEHLAIGGWQVPKVHI
jgi:hypothetical protein